MRKTMKKLTQGATRLLVLALGLSLTATGWADFAKTNPVTGETENYTWKFVGTDTWNGTGYWQNSDSAAPAGVPAKSGDSSWGGSDDQWLPILFDGNTIQINAGMLVEGWNLRMGLYNGANITLQHLVKLQSGVATWFTVDENSTLTIAGMDNNKLEGSNPLCLYSACANGITWTPALSNSAIGTGVQMPIYYYLAGDGTVAFNGGITLTSAQVIKRADVTLSEATSSKTVRSKTLVSFASTSTSTFSADAETTIKVKNSDGTALKDVNLTSVTATDTTLTTAGNVGDCELVQTTTGVVLYYVDYAKTYKPSININFTNGAGNGLTTSADVGLDGYAVPGTSWNNFVVANNTTFNTVNAIDSTGAASVASGVSVSISGTRGHWNCSNLTPASNPLHGYIDENADGPTPTVTITGIPYEHYRVIVYHSTDQNGAKFGYDTINGFNFTYVDGVQTEGTTSWGSAGAANSAEPIGEGTNTLVSAVLSGDTVTMVAHRIGGGSPSARGCFAAIQVVEYVPEVGENDLEIAVDGATNYAVDTAKTLSGTVYLTGSGTLTLTGSEKITAATIDVAKDVVLNINADRLDATTFTGAGTVVYDTTAPVEGKGWASIGWSGTVWIKNQAVAEFEGTKFGNAGSTVRFTGVTGYLQTNTYGSKGYVHTVPLELVDEGNTVAFTYNNGWAGNLVKINTLKGTGTLQTQGSGSAEHIYIVDASGFSGVFNLTCKYVYVGGSQPEGTLSSTNPNGKLEIRSGVTMTVPSGKTWTANGGFVVNGTLNVDGTLASSHTTKAVSGAGMLVFTGRAPTVSGDAWWKNADWTGTVQVKNVTNMVGDSRTGVWLKFNDYGNSGSVVEMNNVTGWLETGYTCTVPLKVTGTLYLNNGGSGKASAFKVGTLLGSGTISGDGSATTVVFNITDDWSGFTGTIGLNNKCIVFGSTIPDTLTAGTIYISEGAVVTPQQASGTWWAVGGIKVDGELRAPNLGKFGGGTTITTSDNGVFTLTDSSNTQDHAVDYARITGTGTLRYADVSGKWRTLSRVNFPTGMICENNLSEGLILQAANTEHVIGSLAGSGVMRSDWGGSYNVGDRPLKILQGKDTTYSGLFHSDDRITTVTVAPGASSAGTLTLSGAQTVSNDLAIESGAAVNLTGTWVGATTVSGTFGGTGTLTGSLTFNDGATFKAFATDADGLSVSGTVSCPAEGTVTVDVSDLTLTADVALLTASNLDKDKFTLTGAPENSTLEVVEGVLTLKLPVTITVPAVANATATATIAGEPITLDANGQAVVPAGSVVTVTYAADSGYQISGTTEYTIDTASATTFDPSQTTQVAAIVATITSADGQTVTPYTSVATAFTEVDDDETLTLTTNYTLTENVEITKSFTLAGSGDVTVSAGGFHFVVTDDAEFAIAGSVTVSAQVWIASTTCTVKVPSTASTLVRNDTSLPMTEGYMLRTSTDEGVTTYWIVQQFVLNVNYSNCAAYLDAEHETPLGYTPVDDGSTIQFVVVPNEGYESPTVTANNIPVVPAGEGWYSVTVDGANVTLVISATIKTFTLTIPVVEHATAVVKVGGAATDNRTFDYGTAITIEWTAASGYRITAGATQTINSITANTTADTPTVEAMGATVSNVNFEYGNDYATATVTATVTGDATSATLSYGGTTYNANVGEGGAVTFENVAVTRGNDIYAEAGYTITAKDGETVVQTTGGSGTTVAADTTSWFSQSSANSGAPVNGSWATAVNLSTPTNVTDNTFTTTESTSSRVVLEFKVCFSSTSADDVSGEAQAAIKLGEVDSATTFMVLTNANEWAAISNAALPPDASETYTVVLTIDYESNTYGVAVNGHVMKDAADSESFPLAASKTSVQTIDFAGSGTLTSMKGDQVEGYMVVDNNGKRYPTIAAAIAAYNADPTIGQLRVLHAGTPPSGWSIVSQGGIDILKKLAKGFFFMAY